MRKWGLYAALLAAVALLGLKGKSGEDVGELQPVQLLAVEYTAGVVHLQTDTGLEGRGKSISKALADLQTAAYGKVFLDTADYLLVRENALSYIEEIAPYLRPSCSLCCYTGDVEPAEGATYLQYHIPELTLGRYQAEKQKIPRLTAKEGRMELVQ